MQNFRLEWISWFNTELLPIAQKLYNGVTGMHGIEHISSVVAFSIIICSEEYPNEPDEFVKSCILAAVLHDCARVKEKDGWDEDHAENAVPKIKAFKLLFNNTFNLQEDNWNDIIEAVRTHTSGIGGNPVNKIASVLWDADRVRLSWFYGYDEQYFSTNTGKRLAKGEKL